MATRKDGSSGLTKPSAEFERMEVYRDLPRDLRGGTLAMQAAGTKHLWKHPREQKKEYARRLQSLVLEPYYWSACEHLAAQPLTRPVMWSDDAPEDLILWSNDIDGKDRDIRTLARSTCVNSIGYGIAYLLVVWSEEDGRPYVTELPAASVLDPYSPPGGMRVLMEVPSTVPPEFPWQRRIEQQLWVLWDGEPTAGGEDRYARYDVYQHDDPTDPTSPWREEPTLELGGSFAPQEYIPLFPIPSGSDSPEDEQPWVSTPPLHPLALMNRLHMNKRSDLDAGLAIANVPQRAASGLMEQEARAIDTVIYKGLWWMANPSGRFYFVEHSGAAFGVSREDIESLERRMDVFGLSPMLSEPSANATATGRLIDLSRATTTAQAWALVWQDAWLQAMRCAARYMSKPDDFRLEFFSDFGARDANLERARVIQQDYLNGDLPPELYYPEMKRLGVYGESFDAEMAAAGVARRRVDTLKALATMPPPVIEGAQKEEAEADEEEITAGDNA